MLGPSAPFIALKVLAIERISESGLTVSFLDSPTRTKPSHLVPIQRGLAFFQPCWEGESPVRVPSRGRKVQPTYWAIAMA